MADIGSLVDIHVLIAQDDEVNKMVKLKQCSDDDLHSLTEGKIETHSRLRLE